MQWNHFNSQRSLRNSKYRSTVKNPNRSSLKNILKLATSWFLSLLGRGLSQKFGWSSMLETEILCVWSQIIYFWCCHYQAVQFHYIKFLHCATLGNFQDFILITVAIFHFQQETTHGCWDYCSGCVLGLLTEMPSDKYKN